MKTPRDCLRTADPRPFSEGMSKRYGHAIILLLHTALKHRAGLSEKLSRTSAVPCLAQRHSEPGNHPAFNSLSKKPGNPIRLHSSPLVQPLIFSRYTPKPDGSLRVGTMKLMHSSATAMRSLLHVRPASMRSILKQWVQVVHDCRQKEHGPGPATRTRPYPACVEQPVIANRHPPARMPSHPKPAA